MAKRLTRISKSTAKFAKVITHDKRLKDVDKELDHFLKQSALGNAWGQDNTLLVGVAFITEIQINMLKYS